MKTPYYRWEEVEALAGRLLRELEALRGEPVALPVDVDAVGEQLLGLSWLYEPIPEPRGTTILAGLVPERRLVVLNERHLEIFGRNEGLERFTKAHELGHWVLHSSADRRVPAGRVMGSGVSGSQADRECMPLNVTGLSHSAPRSLTPSPAREPGAHHPLRGYPARVPARASSARRADGVPAWSLSDRHWQEIQANWFAAALLMPPSALRRAAAGLDVTRWSGRYALRDRCGVSISALNARLRRLGYPDIQRETR